MFATHCEQLPSTCTYADYVNPVPRPCRLAFGGTDDGEGLSSLTMSSGSVQVDVHRCAGPNTDAIPSTVLAYQGDLQQMQALSPCQLDSDCPQGLACTDLAPWLAGEVPGACSGTLRGHGSGLLGLCCCSK